MAPDRTLGHWEVRDSGEARLGEDLSLGPLVVHAGTGCSGQGQGDLQAHGRLGNSWLLWATVGCTVALLLGNTTLLSVAAAVGRQPGRVCFGPGGGCRCGRLSSRHWLMGSGPAAGGNVMTASASCFSPGICCQQWRQLWVGDVNRGLEMWGGRGYWAPGYNVV